jgi:hypothetical protein
MQPQHQFLFGVVALLTPLHAQQAAVFVPAACAQRDGRSGGAWPGFTQRFHLQALVNGGTLANLANRSLTAIAVRRDGQYLPAHAGGRADIDITLSNSPRVPGDALPSFAANRGTDAVEVFRGRVVLPNAPALSNPHEVNWQSPHAVEFPIGTPFVYRGATLTIDVGGTPDASATAPWWRIDYDLFTHDAQAVGMGSSCDPRSHAIAQHEALMPGGTARLVSFGPVASMGIAMLDVTALNPGIDLGFMGAAGCSLRVMPTLMLPSTYAPPVSAGYGGAMVKLQLPAQSHFLGAALYTQWLAFPNPINPAQLTTTNALALQVATQSSSLTGAIVRTGLVPSAMSMPTSGDVLPYLLPVLCVRAQ